MVPWHTCRSEELVRSKPARTRASAGPSPLPLRSSSAGHRGCCGRHVLASSPTNVATGPPGSRNKCMGIPPKVWSAHARAPPRREYRPHGRRSHSIARQVSRAKGCREGAR
eukprot:4255679-Prymnesium_polylepis.1